MLAVSVYCSSFMLLGENERTKILPSKLVAWPVSKPDVAHGFACALPVALQHKPLQGFAHLLLHCCWAAVNTSGKSDLVCGHAPTKGCACVPTATQHYRPYI